MVCMLKIVELRAAHKWKGPRVIRLIQTNCLPWSWDKTHNSVGWIKVTFGFRNIPKCRSSESTTLGPPHMSLWRTQTSVYIRTQLELRTEHLLIYIRKCSCKLVEWPQYFAAAIAYTLTLNASRCAALLLLLYFRLSRCVTFSFVFSLSLELTISPYQPTVCMEMRFTSLT